MLYKFVGPLFGAASIMYSVSATSSDDTRQLDSHEHGHATLNIAVDANQLLMEFESPAANIVGFEHEPKDSAQKEAIKNAVKTLSSGDMVFTLPDAAGCTLKDVDVDAPHSDHDEKEHAHEEKDHDKKKHAHDETHSEFHATWVYACENIGALKTVDVNLIKLFPGTEEIDASVIGQSGQSAITLTPKSGTVTL